MPGNLTYTVRYVAFAAIATAANLAMQETTLRALPAASLALSVTAGTAVGFAVKYLLDKRWIFFDPLECRAQEARKVFLYGMFSVLTTIVFWAFEAAFWIMWETSAAKYSGAVLGLAIGYAAKYELDRRYTFRKEAVGWS
jgi:putative flippase GtrA